MDTNLDKILAKDELEQSLPQFFLAIFNDGREALTDLSPWDRCARIFWLMGPFILLIERTPADAWVSILGLAFIANCCFRHDFYFVRYFWVKSGIIFWFWCLFCALVSESPFYSLGEAIAWFRFPLFAMATVFWLAVDKRLLYAMLLATFLGLFLMCCILIAELSIVGQQGGRLSWPYGDLVSGNYVAKVGLPVFLIMVAFAVSLPGRIARLSSIIALLTMVISLMTGERINFLIRACGGMLAGLLWRPKFSRYIILVFVEIFAVVLLFRFMPHIQNRFLTQFIDQLPYHSDSPYLQAALPGIKAFFQSPIWGIGPANFERWCKEGLELVCHPHPHNFYIQMLAETGGIGLALGSTFLMSTVWMSFSVGIKNKDNVVAATAWVIPFGLFWPVASTADFFGQWNNIFIWSSVALALCSNNLKKRNHREPSKKIDQ